MSWLNAIAIVLQCSLQFAVFLLVNWTVPEPIEDEIIHLEQALHYWKGDFRHWDKRITTPPGLYISSLLLYPLIFLGARPSVRLFRMTSFLFGVGITLISPKDRAWILSLPLLFPYLSLFYTDAGALFFLLLAKSFFVKNQFFLSAGAGLIALLFRQTSIVWIVQLALLRTIYYLDDHKFTSAMYDLLPFLVILAMFGAFVVLNGGIVLGDRKNHKPCLHMSQLLHFSGAYFLLTIPSIVCEFTEQSLIAKHSSLYSCLLVMNLYVLKRWCILHQYHFETRQHITSEFVRNVLTGPQKYLLAPFYALSQLYMILKFSPMDRRILSLAFVTAASLIPARLLEPRYFIVPMIMLIREMDIDQAMSRAIQLEYFMIDATLLYLLVRHRIIW